MENREIKLPGFTRSEQPPGMQFQQRDEQILKAIHDLGGVVAKRQLKDMFWQGKSWRGMERRLSKLHLNGYLDWPSREQRRTMPVPETVCWLGWKGALLLGEKRGLAINPLTSGNENQQRRLENQLRKQSFRWMREPRWIQLAHDLAVVDFRLHLDASLANLPQLSLSEWIPEGDFRSQMDVVEFELAGRDGMIRKTRKGVCPDAYFVLDDQRRKLRGEPYRARFLLELDMATHDNPSFGNEKILPGAAYIHSPEYRRRFGCNAGRWLIVTTAGQRRMENMMKRCREVAGQRSHLFYFTTFEKIEGNKLMTAYIWSQVNSTDPVPLICK